MMFIRRERRRGRVAGVAGVAGGIATGRGSCWRRWGSPVRMPRSFSCPLPLPFCCCSFLTIFGLELRIPWLASPLLPSPPPSSACNRVLRFKDIASFCVVCFFPFPPSPVPPLLFFSSCFFSLFFCSARVLFTPLFPALDFHFLCNFICLPHATQSGHSDSAPFPVPPPRPTLSPSLFLSACLCVLQCVCRSPATASARTHINVLT